MAKVRVPHEWDVSVEARSTVKGVRNWSGRTTAFEIDGAMDDVPERVLMESDDEEKGPEGHVTYLRIEIQRRN